MLLVFRARRLVVAAMYLDIHSVHVLNVRLQQGRGRGRKMDRVKRAILPAEAGATILRKGNSSMPFWKGAISPLSINSRR
ncbi:hypothetical protein CSC3H3_07050 [Thalassospira marina]|uniref:Uncharacterized protein n=1 Tax=Thalassospira marina TaxID=2048283 RepID=A0A2N3KS57_9PROT|nr:hypothetical protein CSC3H3_07050 [Thalassospira marina]PKR53382.1 hypothetical protein COO20_14930 [Thalassospira marina]